MPVDDQDQTPFVGEALLHPVALISVCVLLINDHFLKAYCPGIITGKLSDLSGLVFVPLLLLSLYDASKRLILGQSGCTLRALIACILLTGLVFITIKTTHFGAEAFRRSWAAMQWPAHTVRTHRIDPIFASSHIMASLPSRPESEDSRGSRFRAMDFGRSGSREQPRLSMGKGYQLSAGVA